MRHKAEGPHVREYHLEKLLFEVRWERDLSQLVQAREKG